MWWLVVAVGLFVFRKQIASRAGPLLPSLTPQQAAFRGQLITLCACVVFVLPIELVGLGAAKHLAWTITMWTAIMTSGMTIKANYGLPPMPTAMSISGLKEFAAGPLQPWVQKAMLSVDFNFVFFGLIFVTAYPSILPAAVLGRRALWSVGTHCSKTPEGEQGCVWGMMKPRWESLKAQEAKVLHMSAVLEIVIAFWLTASLFLPSRQILTCLMYWNYLKTRFQAPRSAVLHGQVWREIGDKAQPLLRVAPFVQKPIDMAKDWFKPQYQVR